MFDPGCMVCILLNLKRCTLNPDFEESKANPNKHSFSTILQT